MAWAGSSNINPRRPSQPLPSLHSGNIPSRSRLFSPFSTLSSPQLGNHSLGSPSAGMRPPNRPAPNTSCPSTTSRSHTYTARRGKGRSSSCLTVVTANVRGLRTNVGDLTHNFALRHRADVVAVTETWLTGEIEPTFGKVPGYSHWIRKDRENRAGGGVAACFRDGLQTQELEVTVPLQTEALFFRVVLEDNRGLLLCIMYRPPQARTGTPGLPDGGTRHPSSTPSMLPRDGSGRPKLPPRAERL